MFLICPSRGTGGTSTEPTMSARHATSTFPSTVAPAGLMAAPAPWQVWLSVSLFSFPVKPAESLWSRSQGCSIFLHRCVGFISCFYVENPVPPLQIVSTLSGMGRGLQPTSPFSMWLIALMPAPAMVGIIVVFGSTPANTASQMRPATTIRP